MWRSRSPSEGGTSEHLDDVVVDPFGHYRINRTAHCCLSFESCRVLDDVLNPNEVEERELRIRIDLDQHIKVAIRPCIAARTRAENRELAHTLGAQRRGGQANLGNDLVAGH